MSHDRFYSYPVLFVMDSDENANLRSSGFADERHERRRVSPDSENIELAKRSGLKAKLLEQGYNI